MFTVRKFGPLPALAALVCSAGVAHAQTTITVNNFGFESPGTASSSPAITSWSGTPYTANPQFGVYGVARFSAITGSGFGTTDPDGGTQLAYIAGGYNELIFQDVSTTLVAGTTYTLKVYVGDRADFTGTGVISLQGFSGGAPTGTVLASANGPSTPGSFVQETASFTATPAQAGSNLGIVLSETSGNQALFDDVTLTATPAVIAPEPSQAAALGLGVLGLAGLALRAKRRDARA